MSGLSQELTQRIAGDLDKQLAARARLQVKAQKYWEDGQQSSYWDLLSPDDIGDLYYLINRHDEALHEWQSAIQYFIVYSQWSQANNLPYPWTSFEAHYYLRAGHLDSARAIYKQYIPSLDIRGQEMLAISWMCSGEVDEGRELLRRRLNWLSQGKEPGQEMPALQIYHLGECWFWFGDYEQALNHLSRARETWIEQAPFDPLEGLFYLVKYIQNRLSADKAAAEQQLFQAIEYFYSEGDIKRCVDVKEYIRLLHSIADRNQFPLGLRIHGMSFAD